MSLVKFLGTVDIIISINTHLKDASGLSEFFDLAFLFIEEIWHYVQKWSGYILRYISSKTLAVFTGNNDLVDL